MPIRPYLSEGASFSPDAVATMGKAFQDAVNALGIAPHDQEKRETVAKVIIRLAQENGSLGATALRDGAIGALGDSAMSLKISKDERPDAHRT